MVTCWNCGSFTEQADGCEFCGAASPAAKSRLVALLDALPGPQDTVPHFGLCYLAWQLLLTFVGIWYWPWWAALGAIFISLFLAVPATLLTTVTIQQIALLWRMVRPRFVAPLRKGGLFALEEQTKARLRVDQEAFDALVGIMNREQRHRDLLPEASLVEYRKRKVLPVFGHMVKLSVSALLEIEVRRLINQCERICDGLEDCPHREINERFEQLEAMQRQLSVIKNRWNGYILSHVTTPEVAALCERNLDQFDPRLQPASALTPADLGRLQSAGDTLRALRHALHQTQEIQLLKSAQPLAQYDADSRMAGWTMSSLSTLLKQIQAPERLRDLEQEYQRIVAEQRTIQDAPGYLKASDGLPPVGALPAHAGGEDCKNPIDAPAVLSNSLARS